jgi:outer membrane protein assembly factor BamB
VVAEDVIYIGSQEAKLLALNKEDGAVRWSFPADKDKDKALKGIYGSPAVTEGLVFVGGYNGTLYALNTTTQLKEWEFPTGDPIVGSPIVVEETVIVGSSDGNLYALDTAQGFEKWRFQTGGKIWSTPVVYEDAVYFGSLDHNVYAVTLTDRGNLSEGQEMWRFPTNGAVASTPLIMDGRVYIGSFDRRFYALDAASGAEVWAAPFKAESWFWTRAVSDVDTIYVGSLDGNLYALDANTGVPRWPFPFETNAPIVSAPAVVSEGVLVANDMGDLFLVRPRDGTEIRSFSAKGHIRAPLTVSDSVVYFSAMNHSIRAANLEGGFWRELWCYDTKKSTTQCG